MKKLLFLFIASTSLLVSCNKNDDNNIIENSSPLHGKWEINDFVFETKIDGEIITDEEIEIEIGKGDIIEFKPNNKVITNTYNIESKEWETIEGTYVYNQSDSKISMTFFDSEDQTDYTETLDVLLLNESQLKVGSYYKENIMDMLYEIKMELHLIKKK